MSKISTKNILKKIFKAKPEKKVKKKVTIKKVAKAKKIVKEKVKKTKKVVIKKTTKVLKKVAPKPVKIKKTAKASVAKEEPKVDNLRISKSNEIKPEIKKVKKQETEKREYKIKDHVVYPKHGVGQITEFKKINIGGIDVETYIIKFEKDKANGMVPVNKQSHLRPLATINQVNKCISILKSKPKIKRSMWSRRAQEYEAKISSGKIYELAEVVRDLNKGDDLMVDQSYSERQLFEKDKANGMVPVNKQSHLRPLATINQINKCVSILKSKPKIKRSMWSRRAQEYEAKISSGKIYELAEVVRDLNKGDDLMVDQSYSERQLFEKAYERILSEFQIVLNVSLEDTQKKLNKALKRNLGGQAQPITSTPKSSTTELPVEEPVTDSDENLDE